MHGEMVCKLGAAEEMRLARVRENEGSRRREDESKQVAASAREKRRAAEAEAFRYKTNMETEERLHQLSVRTGERAVGKVVASVEVGKRDAVRTTTSHADEIEGWKDKLADSEKNILALKETAKDLNATIEAALVHEAAMHAKLGGKEGRAH